VVYDIRKSVKDDDAFYTVRWSPIVKADKYTIVRSVPAMGGVAEIYYKDAHGKLNLYMLARSYYGGLRATLRVAAPFDDDAFGSQLLQEQPHRLYLRAGAQRNRVINVVVIVAVTAAQ